MSVEDKGIPFDWREDDLYGRYEIKVSVDVRSTKEMHRVSQQMRAYVAAMEGILGFEIDVVYVIASDRRRKP